MRSEHRWRSVASVARGCMDTTPGQLPIKDTLIRIEHLSGLWESLTTPNSLPTGHGRAARNASSAVTRLICTVCVCFITKLKQRQKWSWGFFLLEAARGKRSYITSMNKSITILLWVCQSDSLISQVLCLLNRYHGVRWKVGLTSVLSFFHPSQKGQKQRDRGASSTSGRLIKTRA